VLAVLVCIPFFLLQAIYETRLSRTASAIGTRFAERAGDLVEKLALTTDAEFYARRELLRVLRVFRGNPKTLVRALTRQSQHFKQPRQSLDLVVGDHNGAILETFPRPVQNLWTYRRLLKGLVTSRADEKDQARKQLEKVLPEQFGKGKNFSYFEVSEGRVIRVVMQQKPGWVLWTRYQKHVLLLVLRDIPSFEQRFESAAQRLSLHRFGNSRYGWGIPLEGTWSSHHRFHAALPADFCASEAWHLARERGTENLQTGDQWWFFRQGAHGRVFFAALPVPVAARQVVSARERLGMAILYVVLLLIFWRKDVFTLPLRGLTVLLFLSSASVPIAGLIIGSILLMDGRHTALVRQAQRRQLETLVAVDDSFDKYLETLRRVLHHETPRLSTVSEVAALPAVITRLEAKLPPVRLEIRRPNGKLLYCSSNDTGGFYSTMDVFYRMAIERWAPHRLDGISEKPANLLSQFFTDENIGFPVLANRPRVFHAVSTSGSRTFFFWDVFPQADFPGAFIAYFFKADALSERFVRDSLLRPPDPDRLGIRLASLDLEKNTWKYGKTAPSAQLTALARQAVYFNQPRSGSLRVKGRTYWYSLYPARNLSNQCLAAMFPDQAIQKRLIPLKNLIWGGMALSFFIAVFLGLLISRRLLRPLATFSLGIQELSRRNFRFQLPVDRQDEFGHLAESFNTALVGLDEYDVAHIVQEGLIQKTFPAGPEFAAHGSAIFAGDLGGDCLDCRRLADGRIFFLVGDISGHGVASALMMSFVKAVIAGWSAEPGHDPTTLAHELDRAIRTSGNRRQFLSLVYGFFTPATGDLMLVTCGHPYPLLRRRNGIISEIGAPTYPLGCRRTLAPIRALPERLNPGDGLLIFTDGLAEAQTTRGEPFGYDRVATWWSECSTLPPDAALVDLRTFHAGACGKPDDDITLFALMRSGEALSA
jgi:serine phosphatase RsbU (regulator of sigma subunit)